MEKKIVKKFVWEVEIGQRSSIVPVQRKVIADDFMKARKKAVRLLPDIRRQRQVVDSVVYEVLTVRFAGEVYE